MTVPKCAHAGGYHTCQPIQFTGIKYSIFIIVGGGGDMAILKNGYRKTKNEILLLF